LSCLERLKSPEGSGDGSRKEGEEEDLQLDHILAVGRGLGVHDVEGQRIQQVRSSRRLMG